jgi:hypothetical protein
MQCVVTLKKQEVLGRTSRLLSYDTDRIEYETIIWKHTDTKVIS